MHYQFRFFNHGWFFKERCGILSILYGVKNLFEKTEGDIQIALRYGEKLLSKDKLELDEKTLAKVPKEIGVYIFYLNDSKAYIGRAIGKNGLYQRIVKQHLYPF